MRASFSKQFLDQVATEVNSRNGSSSRSVDVASAVDCTVPALNKAVRYLIRQHRLTSEAESRWRGWLGMNSPVTVKVGQGVLVGKSNGGGQRVTQDIPQIVKPRQVRFLRENGARYSREQIADAVNAFIAAEGSPSGAAAMLGVETKMVTNVLYRYWDLIPRSTYKTLSFSIRARRSVRRMHKPRPEAEASLPRTTTVSPLVEEIRKHNQGHEEIFGLLRQHVEQHEKRGWLSRILGR